MHTRDSFPWASQGAHRVTGRLTVCGGVERHAVQEERFQTQIGLHITIQQGCVHGTCRPCWP